MAWADGAGGVWLVPGLRAFPVWALVLPSEPACQGSALLVAGNAAVSVRNVATVFRRLLRLGWSEWKITELALVTDWEATEILGGRRQVSFNRLVWVPDRLGVVRSWLGLTVVEDPVFGELTANSVTTDG